MKRLLMLAYNFPPLGGAGVLRSVKFVHYLPRFGWQSVVLSVNEGYRECQDPTLFNEIPTDTEIYRTRSLEPRRISLVQKSIAARRSQQRSWLAKLIIKILNVIRNWLLVPDEQIGWLPFAVWQGLSLARRSDIKIIYSTSMPYTAHLVGFMLKLFCRKPWVVDLRDPWTQNPVEKVPRRSYLMEKMVFKYADRIIANTPNFKKIILRDYPWLDKNDIVALTNGYDKRDFEGLISRPRPNKQFIITYLGVFYQNLYHRGRYTRTPEYFLKGFKKFVDKHRLTPEEVEARFFGIFGKLNEALVAELDLTPYIRIQGFVSHQEALQWQMDSDVLLLIMYDDEADKASVPQKTYEYLASGKPILALVGDDGVAELMRMTNAGLVVNPVDVAAIQGAIETYYEKFKRGELCSTTRDDIIRQFEWQHLTQRLAEVFNNLDDDEAIADFTNHQ